MVRWICACLLLAAGGVAAVWFLQSHLSSAPWSDQQPASSEARPDKKQRREIPQEVPVPQPADAAPRTQSIATGVRGQPEMFLYPKDKHRAFLEPILVPNAELEIIEKQEVPAEKEGVISFIGTDVKPGEVVPPEKQLPIAHLGFLAVPVAEGEKPLEGESFFPLLPNDPKLFRRLREGDPLLPKKLFLAREDRKVRKLQIGDQVKRGQLVGMVKPEKAFEEAASKVAMLDAKEWERYAAMKQKDEYKRRYENQVDTNRRQPGSIPRDEMMLTYTQYEKFGADEKVKEAEIVTAQRAISAALTDLRMHEIHAAIDGEIKAIYKNEQGDAVKPHEAIMQIVNPRRLRVQGLLDLQEALKLKVGMPATIEASRMDSPHLILSGHLARVNCVAVSKSDKPVIVSGSDDETLRGWDAQSGERLWILSGLRSAVRSVACTPPTAKRDLVCFGCADGTVRLLDLNDVNRGPRELSERHISGPVNGIAFSPDGEICATCGEDRTIRLWKTETGERLQSLKGHNGSVTSVRFASAKLLVSAGTDKRLIVWDVESPSRAHRVDSFKDRGGEVLTVSTSQDGRLVLFDQGREIRLLTLADKQLEGTLQSPADAGNFSTMALFSPDGKSILTTAAGGGKLRLWRTPVTTARGSELRQFIWKGTATCGAFAGDSSFAVTGTDDHEVLIWTMPSKEEAESKVKAHLTLVEKHLDTQSRQVRVHAELQSPYDWLIPGMRATMVIVPEQK